MIEEIYGTLLDEYGEPPEPEQQSDIDYLIGTILSQNTNDTNRDRAHENLRDRFGDDYRAIENANREEVLEAIRVAGLGPTKTDRIQEALRIVRDERGEYTLDFLKEMAVEEAKDWLTEIPGVGPKTAAIILCFHFGMPVIPVDTHVHRVSKRLGLVPEDASREKTHEILEEKVPDDLKYPLHRLMITHGRETCTARNPSCESCPLRDRCRYYREEYEG